MAAHTERERLEQVLLGQSELMFQVHLWMEEEQKRDDIIRALVSSSRKQIPVPAKGLDKARIFSASAIERMCVKYRLRFLPGGLFKGEVPAQAVLAVRALEREVGEAVTSFMVMAPAERFKLCDSEVDPLLFVPIGEQRYYLVHKWGHDLSTLRSVAYWPVRDPMNLFVTILFCAVAFAAVLPSSLISADATNYFSASRLFLVFWSIMVFGGFATFGWFAFFGQFSKDAWNSRYFN